ncbi:MAG: DUF4153 domain-containing protein [Pseudooceanicola sp.]
MAGRITETQDETGRVADRLVTGGLGALAGMATWALAEAYDGTRLMMFASAFILGVFAVFFALIGQDSRWRVALTATALVLPAALLLLWASFRHASVESFLDRPHDLAAFVFLLSVATPFAAAGLRGGWREYSALFEISWTIFVRFVVALVFTVLFWVVVRLSDSLLNVVGIDLIDQVLRYDPVPFVLTGGAFGVALAVAHEFRRQVSYMIPVTLLRVLLPPVLAVVVLFVVAMPLRGFSDLFGGFSTAAAVICAHVVLLTLVTAALGPDDGRAVSAPWMRMAARAGAGLSPVLGGFGLWAVWLRVAPYGWTPERVLAAVAAVSLMVYGIVYAVAALRRGDWMDRVRAANATMALALVAVAAVWLTPLLNAERISSRSQVVRYADGTTSPEQMPLYELAHDWGRAGQAGLARLEAMEDEALSALILSARSADNRYVFDRHTRAVQTPDHLEVIAERLRLLPADAEFPVAELAGLEPEMLRAWAEACENTLPDGTSGCLAVSGVFWPTLERPQALVLLHSRPDYVQPWFVGVGPDGAVRLRHALEPGGPGRLTVSVEEMMDIGAGDYRIAPARLNGLRFGDRELIPNN